MTDPRTAPLTRRWLVALWVLATVPFLSRLAGGTSYDIKLYWTGGSAVLQGAKLYTDVVFEYPPYALIWFVGPAAIAANLAQFRLAFGLLIWAIDAGVKGVLLVQAARAGSRLRDLAPFVMYVLATAALGHLLLQRYDVIPAALSLAALLALVRGWTGTAGALVAIAAGAKVYPALYVPVMAIYAWRRSRRGLIRFLTGALIASLPLLVAAWWIPWWRFATFQANRGLQVESAWASLVWMLHFAGVPARWEVVTAWHEVTGPVAAWLVGPSRAVWIAATGASLARAAWVAWRLPWSTADAGRERTREAWLSSLALLMLMPVTSFVAFSPVLSPQFHLWLLPWCALALAAPDPPGFDPRPARRAVWCVLFSTLIVPVFYPSPAYTNGLDMGRTAVLLLRNSLLLYAAVCLWVSGDNEQRTTNN